MIDCDYADPFSPNFALTVACCPGPLEEYGRFQQHLGLLEDQFRVMAYLNALSSVPIGNTIVDVGAGTGIWGIVGLKRGFERAILIEPSRKISQYARHLAELNGVSERVTIIVSRLEDVSLENLPTRIDLIVTETLSSLIFGFGSWDALPRLAERLSNRAGIIPLRGHLYGSLANRDFATRGPETEGLLALKAAGLSVDLFERTFRSGGNIYKKEPVIKAILHRELLPECIAHFNFLDTDVVGMASATLQAPETGSYLGIVFHWEVQLGDGQATPTLSSLDPRLTSWYPYYVPFLGPIALSTDERLEVRLELHAVDYPYKYAFKISGKNGPLTHMLYW